MQTLRDNIIEALLRTNKITKEQLDKALQIQRQKQMPLRSVLIKEKLILEDELLFILSEQLFIPILHLTKYKFDPEIVKIIPDYVARKYNIIALSRMGNTLTVAISDPLNIFALDDLKTLTSCNIDIVLSSEQEIAKAIGAQYHLEGADMQNVLDADAARRVETGEKDAELVRQDEIELSSALAESQNPPIVKLVDLMLAQALQKRASDIHIEPEYDDLRIRYRVDGALQEVFKVPKAKQNAVIARLKIISNLDITENRVPQDGRFRVKFEGREVDFRVSSLPTTFGQKFVLRALDKGNLSIGLDKLGFSPQPLATFKVAVTKPFGMLLVTGPTGSGKSTTLYSVLNQLNTPEKNIITIEDPVEYQLDGITQVQVRPDIGLDFVTGLRSLLRQSPDVIMIGEIRDSETADIAIKASLTGQIVLSTLHTNDAISSITRLIDMGVEPFLVASSLVLLCAQRLCRRICLKCRKPIELPQDYLQTSGFVEFMNRAAGGMKEKIVFYHAPGCSYCNNTGFHGRIAVLETVLIDDAMREMIVKKKSIDEIKDYAIHKCDMRILRDDVFLKVKDGLTTIDEAIRITTEE